jgi:hypothetical protein
MDDWMSSAIGFVVIGAGGFQRGEIHCSVEDKQEMFAVGRNEPFVNQGTKPLEEGGQIMR